MKSEEKTLFATVAVAIFLIWFFKPKGGFGLKKESTSLTDKYAEPQLAMDGVHDIKENAVTGLTAMREAIDNKEPKRELDKLKDIILKEYGVKIMISTSTHKLRAMSKDGKVIAEET
jgi:hypothetical protein